MIDDGDVRIYHGSALEQLRTLPDESVQCIVTSPPFWALRDYGVDGQIGLEPTPDAWCQALVAVFRECRRVLRHDGCMFLEVGDTYNSPGGRSIGRNESTQGRNYGADTGGAQGKSLYLGAKEKDLVGAPWLLAFALRADGWYLRSDIIWARPNPMPESVTDRPTKAHSYVFLLTKSARYFYDADAIREDYIKDGRKITTVKGTDASEQHRDGERWPNPVGANARSVWSIPTEPTPFAHFATFPQALVERCIKAGTSEHGCCAACGAPWVRIVERDEGTPTGGTRGEARDVTNTGAPMAAMRPMRFTYETKGWASSCECRIKGDPVAKSPAVPCVVLDPFMGSGTTALVARRLGRHAIGIELNAEYIAIARRRLEQLSLFAPEIQT